MKIMVKRFSVLFLVLLVLCSFLTAGCLGDTEQLSVSSASRFAALLVPDTNLDLYVYAKQDRPTIVPAKIVNLSQDIKVESLAIWGLPSGKNMVFGAGLTFASSDDAAEIYSNINFEKNGWKILRDNKIFIVRGSGAAAESLKSAILNNNYKYYTNRSVLQSVAMLPRSGRTKMVAIGVVKPSNQVLEFVASYLGNKDFEQLNKILKILNPEVVMGGLYSPHQINVAKAVEVFEKGSGVDALDVGMLISIKSGLPSFVVSAGVKNVLKDYSFIETQSGELTLYKGTWSASGSNNIPIIIRIEGNHIFMAISGQEAYAQTLIMSIYK